MKKLNVLITGAGGAAAVAFYQSVKCMDINIYMADMSPHSTGLYLVRPANRYLLRASKEPEFIDDLFQYCFNNEIDVLIPTVDSELAKITKNSAYFEKNGIKVMSSGHKSILQVIDKYQLMKNLENNFKLAWFKKYDRHLDLRELAFPCLAKPRCDSGSRGIKIIETPDDLLTLPTDGKYLLQRYLPGKEYSVDVYLNKDSHAVASVVRERVKIYGGVAVVSKTVDWSELSSLAARIAEHLNLRYAVNVQFKTCERGKPYLLEINPRFPGTTSLTVASGVNMPRMCIHEAMGIELKSFYPYEEIAMVRYWQEVFMPVNEFLSHKGTELA